MSVGYYTGYSPSTGVWHITDEVDCLPADVRDLETCIAHSPEEALGRALTAHRVVTFQVGSVFYETPDEDEREFATLSWVRSLPKDSIYGEIQDRIKVLALRHGD